MKAPVSFTIVGSLIGLLGICVVFAAVGQRRDAGEGGAGRVATVAHGLPVSHPVHQGMEEFGRELTKLSDGRFKVRIYPSEQLGTETEYLEKLQQGSIDIAKVSAAPVGNFVPLFKIFSLPYLFRDHVHYWKVLDGPVGRDLLDALGQTSRGAPSGLVGLGYYDAGSRSFYSTRLITSPADLAGMKIRVQQDPVAEATVRAMGASAVTMSFGELYTSLQQGGVDGAENNPPSFHSSRHFEVCRHYVLDEHSSIPDVLIAGARFWESLTEEEKGWVREAAIRSSHFQRKLWAAETERSLAELAAAGVSITAADKSKFRKASQSVTEQYATGAPSEMVRRIEATR